MERALVDVGPEHRVRHGHPPEHRLPVPDGPLLLGARRDRRARLGRAAALARQILLFAGLGDAVPAAHARRCAGRASPVGALAFMLSPYSLDYAARISVILLPWAGLPWLLAFVIRGVAPRRLAVSGAVRAHGAGRRQRQRDRARLRRASRRVLWIPYAVWVAARGRRSGARSATVAKIGAADARRVAVVDLRALGAGRVRPRHPHATPRRSPRCRARRCRTRCCAGSATGSSTAGTSSAPGSSRAPTTRSGPFFIIVSYGIPVLAMLVGRGRALAAPGVLHPRHASSAWSSRSARTRTTARRRSARVFKELATTSTAAFALRSTGRATPLVVLGLAVLLAAGVNALAAWCRGTRHAAPRPRRRGAGRACS